MISHPRKGGWQVLLTKIKKRDLFHYLNVFLNVFKRFLNEGRFLAISVLVWMSNMLITGLQYDGDLGRPRISSAEVVSR